MSCLDSFVDVLQGIGSDMRLRTNSSAAGNLKTVVVAYRDVVLRAKINTRLKICLAAQQRALHGDVAEDQVMIREPDAAVGSA